MQTFTAPIDGVYKLEVWGAEGGLTSQARLLNMGKGGYSVGSINLPQDQLLYIFVGGKGNMGLKNNGGYNGGGHNEDIGNYNVPGGGGGGMSHISFEENPVLSNETWNPNGTIIVAGGGSGYIGGVSNALTIAGDQTFPKPKGGTETGHSGDGYAIISWISPSL